IDNEIPVTLQVETESDKFAISPSGEFTTKVKLDYDEGAHNYSVEISISDGVSNDRAVVDVRVTDVNDNSPVFASDSVTKSVPEDTEVGSNVTAVPATDKDSSFNKELRYSLRGGEGRFSVDPVSAMVTVAGALDREAKAEYNLLLVAEDQGRPYEAEVLETEAVGTSLLTLSAADPDEGANGRVSYSIFQQSPSSHPDVFELDSSSGTLRLAQPLDYSEVKVYRLKVQASDGGTPSLIGNGSVVVKVKDVNNNPPEFSKESYDVAVPENLANGASILRLEVTDRDEVSGMRPKGHLSELRYSLRGGEGRFSVDPVSAMVTVAGALDRETKAEYNLLLVAEDQGRPARSATATLLVQVSDINDNVPKFSEAEYEAEVLETEAVGTSLLTLSAVDPDDGANGRVTQHHFPRHPRPPVDPRGPVLRGKPRKYFHHHRHRRRPGPERRGHTVPPLPSPALQVQRGEARGPGTPPQPVPSP
uniref:Cadherin domain-containing protein n=1 Tax=Mastacembelus armatus TaxID=205130 RepID=A0A7N8X4H9_9TELE